MREIKSPWAPNSSSGEGSGVRFWMPGVLLLASVVVLLLALRSPPTSTELGRAAYQGDVATVTEHLARGADPNTRSEDGTPIVLEAVAQGKLDTAAVIFETGANPTLPTRDGLYGLDLVALSAAGFVEAAEWLVDAGVDPCVMRSADAAPYVGERNRADLARDNGNIELALWFERVERACG